MPATHRVSVERNRLRFAAAHMATYHGDLEPLHGHNYDVMVEIEGELTEDAWVWDFGDLKRQTKGIIDALDHRFILQRDGRLIDIEETPESWVVRFRDRRYVFPRADVVALPIDNSTAERLAEWIAGRLVEHYRPLAQGFRKVTVGVEESPGQAGWYTVET